jgi:hypothetical protein
MASGFGAKFSMRIAILDPTETADGWIFITLGVVPQVYEKRFEESWSLPTRTSTLRFHKLPPSCTQGLAGVLQAIAFSPE